jgi:glycine betaine/proline transport system ATP-binding protein
MSAQIVAASGAPVPATALVADVAERVLSSDAPVAVVDGQGKVVGSIDRAMMIATIFGTGKA